MRGYPYLIGLFLLILSACGGNDAPNAQSRPKLVGGPLVIKIDPKDKERFAAIRTAPISERKKRQVEFLQSYGHDLQWFPETIGEIETSDTVQIIYFDYHDEATGWCSGKFISDNFVATAGHCNSAISELQVAGAPCEDDVLFAYKRRKGDPIEYYSCEKLSVYAYNTRNYTIEGENGKGKQEREAMTDHALFQLREHMGTPPARASVKAGADWLRTKGFLSGRGEALVGLVVDPPSSGSSLVSKFDVVVNKSIDEASVLSRYNLTPNDSNYMESVSNQTQPGNSGGPFYTLDKMPKLARPGDGTRFTDVLKYVAPLHGSYTGTPIMVIPRPQEALNAFFAAAFPGGL